MSTGANCEQCNSLSTPGKRKQSTSSQAKAAAKSHLQVCSAERATPKELRHCKRIIEMAHHSGENLSGKMRDFTPTSQCTWPQKAIHVKLYALRDPPPPTAGGHYYMLMTLFERMQPNPKLQFRLAF